MKRAPLSALLLALAALPCGAQAPYATPHPPLLGSAWYPEQWPESRWDADLTLMEQAHFNVVRIGEFAWARMEPVEGQFDFAWLDRAIALAAQHHIAVVLGTPTDAPPAWLTTKYPQTLRVDENGKRAEHGGRRQFDYASPLYRRFCVAIDTQLARRYGHNGDVIGWQIGNEYTDESFDPATRAQFQQFLHDKYKTLANLNTRWTTAYWSQTYTAWSQIPLEAKSGNPGLLLEHKHFVTTTWRSFQRAQIDALRPWIDKSQFLTTNIGGLGWSDNWDHYAITADLNLASWDDYVGEGHLDVLKNAMLNDFVRGWRRQNFWVMETEPGSVNWAPINNALAPGETRALAWQAVGHGADAVLYWQWRSALNGQEQYHGTIVGPDGTPQPIYPELAELGSNFAATSHALAGTAPHAQIALLYTYDSRWAIEFQPQTTQYDQEQILLRFYTPLEHLAEARGESVDIVDPMRGSLDGYTLLVAPSLNVIDDAMAQKLAAWVQAGGHLVLGPRSGMKDDYDALQRKRQPGPLVPALGARVEQYYALDGGVGLTDPQHAIPAGIGSIWAEYLEPNAPDTVTHMLYADPGGWLDGKAAMVTRKLGKGSISYLGTVPDASTLAAALDSFAALPAPITNAFSNPAQTSPLELCTREQGSGANARRVYIAINHGEEEMPIVLYLRVHSLLPGIRVEARGDSETPRTTVWLPPQGVAVLVPDTQSTAAETHR